MLKRPAMLSTGTRQKKRVPVLLLLLTLLAAGYRYVHMADTAKAEPSASARPVSDIRHPDTQTAGPSGLEPFSGRCVGVSDGDTLVVMTEQQEQIRVRLFGVDAPEKKQAFGERAKQFVSDTAFGKILQIHPHDRDRYGRVVADVYLEDHSRLNELLVREGLAWWYRTYAPHDMVLMNLEQQARSQKKGLWRDPNPVPPWEFRRNKDSKKRSRVSAKTDRSAVPDPPRNSRKKNVAIFAVLC